MGITIWTTTQCNLQCSYCYERKTGQKEQVQVLTDCDAVLHWLEKTHLWEDSIHFHGGEPLLNFKFMSRLIDVLDKKGILPKRIEFTTNGTIMNEEIVEFIKKYSDRITISISIDGTLETHDACRKTKADEGTYQIVEANIQRLKRQTDACLWARMTVTPDTVANLYKNVKHLVKMGFRQIGAALDSHDLNWNEEDIDILRNEIFKLISFWKRNQGYYVPFVNDIINRRPKGRCTFSYNIYADGNIYPCIAVAGMKDYNIGSIEKGIDKEKEKCLYANVHEDYAQCISCENKKYCVVNRCKFMNVNISKKREPNILDCRLEALKLELESELADYMYYQ